MIPIAWHLMYRLENGQVLASTPGERRILVNTVLQFAPEFGIFLYSAPDTHLHVAAACDRGRAGDLARRLANALHYALAVRVRFERTRIVAIEDQRHLSNLPAYILGNAKRHGCAGDTVLEATNLPDILGLRVVDRTTGPLLHRMLPRLRRADLLAHLEVDDLVAGRDLDHLAEAAASAVAEPILATRSPRSLEAKAAAVQVARRLGVRTGELSARLETSSRNVLRLGERPHDPRLARAISFQIGLRERRLRSHPLE